MSKSDSTDTEDVASLQARIASSLAAIDLSTDISPLNRSSIAIAELSGTPMRVFAKKLSVLADRGDITGDDYRRLILASIEK